MRLPETVCCRRVADGRSTHAKVKRQASHVFSLMLELVLRLSAHIETQPLLINFRQPQLNNPRIQDVSPKIRGASSWLSGIPTKEARE